MKTIVWFRQDLRRHDNPALSAAAASGAVVPIFILDEVTAAPEWQPGGASCWWLHHSLEALAAVRRWCPELARLPDQYIHAPFAAPPVALQRVGVDLARTYPAPIVEHDLARKDALAGYERVRKAASK